MERLPPEILREIFLKTVSLVFMSWTKIATREIIATPLRISHVCHTWRDIALSDGRLWSYLYIDYYSLSTARRGRAFKPIFDALIARSADAPLNYAIDWNFKRAFVGKVGIGYAIYVMKTLIKEHRRWRDVDLYCVWDDQFPDDFGPFHLTDMPMLTTLQLQFKGHSHFTFDLGRSSRLRRVSLGGNFSIVASKEPLLHLKEPSKLAFFDCDDTIQSCQNFLSIAPFLEVFQVEFNLSPDLPSFPLDNDRPVYPGLRRLRLKSFCGSEFFLDSVTLPSLCALELFCSFQDGGQTLLRFLERSLPPLTHLDIHHGCFIHEDYLIPCLKLLPTLTTLDGSYMPVSAQFFRALTVPESGSGDILCPSLEDLRLDFMDCLEDPSACAEALISMLESRTRVSEAFKKVWFLPLERGSTIHPSRIRDYDQAEKEYILEVVEVGEDWKPFSDVL